MDAKSVDRFVFSSSATVYGVPEQLPLTEDAPVRPINPYGHSKAMVEQILRDWCAADAARSAVSLRYFNPIGAHPSGTIGEDPQDIPNNLFPFIAQVAVGKRERLNVWGQDWPTADGTGVRDYLHVVDLAQGHLAGIEYALRNPGFMAVNLGTGRAPACWNCCKRSKRRPVVRSRYVIGPRRDGDVARAGPTSLAPEQCSVGRPANDRAGLRRRLALAKRQPKRLSALVASARRYLLAEAQCGTIAHRADPDRQDLVHGRCRPCAATGGRPVDAGSGSADRLACRGVLRCDPRDEPARSPCASRGAAALAQEPIAGNYLARNRGCEAHTARRALRLGARCSRAAQERVDGALGPVAGRGPLVGREPRTCRLGCFMPVASPSRAKCMRSNAAEG